MTMECRKDKTATQALISGLIGIIFFLIMLIILNYIAVHISWPLFSGFVDLLYANAVLIIIFSVLFMFGNIFATFVFPFNLPFPIFNAVASVLLVSFIIRLMGFLDSFYSLGIGSSLEIVKTDPVSSHLCGRSYRGLHLHIFEAAGRKFGRMQPVSSAHQ